MRSSGGGEGINDINVTPLVDVVLVLLVVLMVAATALANKSMAVELPKASTGEATGKQEPLVVAVDESGALSMDGRPATDGDVRARARSVPNAVVAADGRARHASVVHVLDLLRAEHVVKIAIVVQP
jgi:biopolymer transport protein ExbD